MHPNKSGIKMKKNLEILPAQVFQYHSQNHIELYEDSLK